MTNNILPITDEQARAVQEAFKFGGQSLETSRAFGGWLARVLGTVPEDLIGLLGGDWIRVKRAENIVKTLDQAKERLDARKVEDPKPIPLSVAVPLLAASSNEDREELVDLWARLIAAAMDPSRSKSVRLEFVDVMKKLGPLDALVLNSPPPSNDIDPLTYYTRRIGLTSDEVEVSLHHLMELGLLRDTKRKHDERRLPVVALELPAFGRELLRVLRD